MGTNWHLQLSCCRWKTLSETGVRFIYKEQNNKFSQDLEPEYVTFSKDEKKAYICLQVRISLVEVVVAPVLAFFRPFLLIVGVGVVVGGCRRAGLIVACHHVGTVNPVASFVV